MQEAEFVVMFTRLMSLKQMQDYADVILPIATFAETDGTYVNAEGHWQTCDKSHPSIGKKRDLHGEYYGY